MEDKKEIQKLEEEEGFLDVFNDFPPADIVAFNELRSCADLLRLYNTEQLDIQPDFQRDIVWSKPDQTRFIDSLIKQLPIPSMCLSLNYKTEKRIVIDGLQRMQSIINFLSDDEWKLSELMDIDERLSGKTVHTIKTKSKEIYDRVQNLMIPITVIRCDFSKREHMEYLFTIFHRLNSGGLKLNNQEIRNCIYNGDFNNLLKKLAKLKESETIFGQKRRFGNEEMILRFFAFNTKLLSYNGKLSKFLNTFMHDNRNIKADDIAIYEKLYCDTARFLGDIVFEGTEQDLFGKTFLEGLLYGIAKNLEKLKMESPEKIQKLFNQFKELPAYDMDNLKEGLSVKEKVCERLTSSEECFAK